MYIIVTCMAYFISGHSKLAVNVMNKLPKQSNIAIRSHEIIVSNDEDCEQTKRAV